ncbi:MAG: hypothetical protein RLZZ303_3196 [Candidatus Hydrogenedentota bacterium]|jgi:uncharacterized tellurite resistance protein B-like protein
MIDRLSNQQRLMLMELLVAMAKVDGRIVTLENEVIEDYANLLEVPLDEVSGDFSIAELAPYFDTPASRVTAIQELCRLARLDGDFAAEERDAILEVAGLMGVPERLVSRIDAWVVEGMQWVAQGEDLIAALR